jgi:hypothetical protein
MKSIDDNAAAGIFTFVLLFLVCSVVYLAIGFGTDKITAIGAKMFIDTAASQMRFSITNWELQVFRAEPLIMFLSIGINYWVSELRQFSGMADTSTMIVASVEMITLTLVIIVFTLYGGYGLDTLVNIINHNTVVSPDLALFGAVQYISPLFYIVMFLILIGVVVQFVMTCVRTIDFQQYQ